MAIERRHLLQHLELAAQAYGPDLRLPAGRLEPRSPQQPAPAPAAPVQTAAQPAAPTAPPFPSADPTRAQAPAPGGEGPAPLAQLQPTLAPPPPAPTNAAEAIADPAAALQALRAELTDCQRCKLHQGRQHIVFGEGNPRTRVLFVGEAPGAVEDQTGRPFVGPAGQLLDRILTGAMGLQRSEVFIANINKCRPPGNREPAPDEVAACLPFLRRQVQILRPEVIVCLGRTAAQNLLGTTQSTTALRGREHDYHGVPVVVTWHPAYLLREPARKRETWDDIKRVNRLLGRPEVPPPASS